MFLGNGGPPPAAAPSMRLDLVQPVAVGPPFGKAEALRHCIAGRAAAALDLMMRG